MLSKNCSLSPLFAFKEWALVCEALGSGDQSILLRKGGIAEGRKGFGFEQEAFFLFPTWFHGQLEKTRLQQAIALSNETPDILFLEHIAVIEKKEFVTDKEKIAQLAPFHILNDSVIEERMAYKSEEGTPGIHVAFVRVYRLNTPIELPMEKRFGGCRSWIELPSLEVGALVSVLSNEEHEQRSQLLEGILKRG